MAVLTSCGEPRSPLKVAETNPEPRVEQVPKNPYDYRVKQARERVNDQFPSSCLQQQFDLYLEGCAGNGRDCWDQMTHSVKLYYCLKNREVCHESFEGTRYDSTDYRSLFLYLPNKYYGCQYSKRQLAYLQEHKEEAQQLLLGCLQENLFISDHIKKLLLLLGDYTTIPPVVKAYQKSEVKDPMLLTLLIELMHKESYEAIYDEAFHRDLWAQSMESLGLEERMESAKLLLTKELEGEVLALSQACYETKKEGS